MGGPRINAIMAAGACMRDLTTKGIEPNPGLRHISQNITAQRQTEQLAPPLGGGRGGVGLGDLAP